MSKVQYEIKTTIFGLNNFEEGIKHMYNNNCIGTLNMDTLEITVYPSSTLCVIPVEEYILLSKRRNEEQTLDEFKASIMRDLLCAIANYYKLSVEQNKKIKKLRNKIENMEQAKLW